MQRNNAELLRNLCTSVTDSISMCMPQRNYLTLGRHYQVLPSACVLTIGSRKCVYCSACRQQVIALKQHEPSDQWSMDYMSTLKKTTLKVWTPVGLDRQNPRQLTAFLQTFASLYLHATCCSRDNDADSLTGTGHKGAAGGQVSAKKSAST